MKKTFSVILAALLLLALCSCGSREAGAEEEPAPVTTDLVENSVFVTDEQGGPIPGVMLQLCCGSRCSLNKTGPTGEALFRVNPGVYTVQLLQVPEGYLMDESEYPIPEPFGSVTIVLRTDEPQAAEETAAPETEDEGSDAGTGMSFSTWTLDGAAVTSREIFGGHQVTMINLWATWCPPCRAELPDLARLSGEFEAQGCQIVGLCIDADSDAVAAEAARILADSGADYPNYRYFDGLETLFDLYAVPTSFFVDSHGNVLTEPVVGAYPEGYTDCLAEALAKLG